MITKCDLSSEDMKECTIVGFEAEQIIERIHDYIATIIKTENIPIAA